MSKMSKTFYECCNACLNAFSFPFTIALATRAPVIFR
jgi:hypothetical protein